MQNKKDNQTKKFKDVVVTRIHKKTNRFVLVSHCIKSG
jgi:hypothetical protein